MLGIPSMLGILGMLGRGSCRLLGPGPRSMQQLTSGGRLCYARWRSGASKKVRLGLWLALWPDLWLVLEKSEGTLGGQLREA